MRRSNPSELLLDCHARLRRARNDKSGWNIAKRSSLPTFACMKSESATSATAVQCWIENRRVWLGLSDQRTVSFPAAKYPLLASAAPEELAKVTLRVQGHALRWESLDENIWVDDAVAGRFPRPTQAVAD